MILILLGPPGAGKGTQAEPVARRLGIPKIATGDVLRAAVREGTEMGKAAQRYMDAGELVPDHVILAIMKETFARPEMKRGVILDGVVRTVPQAEGLERVLRELGRRVDAVLLFEVPDDELVRRLSGRTICERCQTPFTGREPGTECPKCGGRLVRRKDDEPEAVRRRLQVYREQTAPVIDWYRSNGTSLVAVDAVGTPDEVTERVVRALPT
ncbi:MAG TPA: adenylate kinase [Gemmatimonadaceae bacterium]|nr:adenylate kinase [Gemmatimonadaceae bacterium]